MFRQGDDPKGEAFVVHAGVVEVRRWVGESEQAVARLGEGELFGELALFRHGPRTASAVAATDVELLELSRETFAELEKSHPRTALKLQISLAQDLAERLREAQGPLREFLIWQISKRQSDSR